MNTETTIECARVGTKIVMAIGVKKIVSTAISSITPKTASIPTKIIYKVGSIGIASVAVTAVNKDIDKTFDTIQLLRAEAIKAIETEVDQNDSGDPEEGDE